MMTNIEDAQGNSTADIWGEFDRGLHRKTIGKKAQVNPMRWQPG